MATKRFTGNAQDIAEVKTVQITAHDASTTYKLTINNKVISVTGAGSVNATATALAEAWNDSDIPEVAEITADDSTDTVTLTHDTDGVPFTVTSSVSGGTGTIGAVSTTTSATGKHFWDNTANWDSGSLPVTGVSEQQTLTITGTPTGGTFTMTYSGQTTSAIAYNASAATVQAALEALSNIGTGNMVCTGGALPGTPVVCTFSRDLGYQNVAQMTTTDSLTGGSTPASSVSTTQAGSAGDDVVIDYSATDIKYGLGQSAVILNSLTIAASYTGAIGLPKINEDGSSEYVEYRTDYLAIGVAPGVITVGNSTGDGSGRIKLNTGSTFTQINVLKTASASDDDVEALLWKGSDNYNEMTCRGDCSIGIAVYGGESATLITLKMDGDAEVRAGSGATLTTVTHNGSRLELWNGCTTLTQSQGESFIEGGSVTTLTLQGGTCTYNSTGAITTPTLSGNSTLDFANDPRAKSCGTIELYGPGATVLDPDGVVSSLVVDFNQEASVGQVAWGRNRRLTRGSVS